MESLGRSQGQTPEGSEALKVCGRGTSRGNPFIMIAPRFLHIMSFFCHPKLVKWDFFQPMDFLGSIMVNIQGMKPYILVELNPIILGRDVEIIITGQSLLANYWLA